MEIEFTERSRFNKDGIDVLLSIYMGTPSNLYKDMQYICGRYFIPKKLSKSYSKNKRAEIIDQMLELINIYHDNGYEIFSIDNMGGVPWRLSDAS